MTGELDYSKLLGFGTIDSALAAGVDFQDATIAAKIGAKVGDPTSDGPAALPE